MISFILKKIFGTQNERALRKMRPAVEKISSFEVEISKLSIAELRAKTDEFKARLKKGAEESKEEEDILNEILPEAFAVVREVAKRTVNMRHFDVQLIGGMVLHRGKIAEMATGEGKTLVATLAAYLNALSGRGVHIVTVNDYLARRDREWMGPIYETLGLTVGVLQHDMDPASRKQAYSCDIVYGTNNEFGFDYLRDNMVSHKEQMVQREANFAIVDEVDSILVDEARTPLIISGPAEESTDMYYKIDRIIPRLKKGSRDETTKEETGDFVIDEKGHNTYLTEEGEAKVIELLGIKDMHSIESMEYKHHVNQALRAHHNFSRDKDYIIKDDGVLIVDEFTGRLMPGRRWSDGLHQAVEAKEGVKIERENQTLATITLQNYFKMYKKLSGMTGTAETEAVEFEKIYNLGVVVIPPNRRLERTNYSDAIYKTEKEKFKAVCDEIENLYRQGRPVLVGTISIEKNEKLSRLLKQRNIPHNLLNAKYHELEAHIIAQAGRANGITIATNMAGRGTDILLGGNPEFLARDTIAKLKSSGKDLSEDEEKKIFDEMKQKTEEEHKRVVEVGGLHVLGTERHEARRIDNQLRGRSGRQGDPGSSRFFLSLEDDLMRIFGSGKISTVMTRLGMEEGQEIQHPLVTRAIATAQKRVEEHNFGIRKHLLEYDNVMNKQREIIYGERKNILSSETLKDYLQDLIEEVIEGGLDIYLNKGLRHDEWDFAGLGKWLKTRYQVDTGDLKLDDMSIDEIREAVLGKLKSIYAAKEKVVGENDMRNLEKVILLHIIDSKWKDHLHNMDNLRDGIGLRAYGQRDPLIEYQHEGYEMFTGMIDGVKEEALEFLLKVQTVGEEKRKSGVFESVRKNYTHEEKGGFEGIERKPQAQPQTDVMGLPQPQSSGRSPHEQEKPTPYRRETPKVGRNEPCPCGSGKKFKKCCGK